MNTPKHVVAVLAEIRQMSVEERQKYMLTPYDRSVARTASTLDMLRIVTDESARQVWEAAELKLSGAGAHYAAKGTDNATLC